MYNQYNPYNQYYNPQRYQQPVVQPQTIQPIPDIKVPTLQGKLIDNIDVVKVMDIPLDGSISYYPLTDGSGIVTKQLMSDGTSKTILYKPSDDKVKNIKYITSDELDKAIKKIDLTDIKEEIDAIKKQIKKLRDKDE